MFIFSPTFIIFLNIVQLHRKLGFFFCICREWDEVRAHLSMCDSSRSTVMNNLLTHGLVFFFFVMFAFYLVFFCACRLSFAKFSFWFFFMLSILFDKISVVTLNPYMLQLFVWIGQTNRFPKYRSQYFFFKRPTFHLSTCEFLYFLIRWKLSFYIIITDLFI